MAFDTRSILDIYIHIMLLKKKMKKKSRKINNNSNPFYTFFLHMPSPPFSTFLQTR